MLYFLLLCLIVIQISILALMVWSICFNDKIALKEIPQNTDIKNISPHPPLELIKQIIHLEKFTLGFKTPYNGYLYITAQACDVYFSDDSFIKVKTHLDGLFLEKDELIFIKNPINPKKYKIYQF